MPAFINMISIVVTILASLGLTYIVYSRGIKSTSNRLFLLTLILILGYIVSHAIHFMLVKSSDVTLLDQSCHSFLLLILVALTFFSYNFPQEKKMNPFVIAGLLVPTISLLYMLWSGYLVSESHMHEMRFEAHYTKYYPLFLGWYIFLLILNTIWLIKKMWAENVATKKKQILFFLIGVIITNFTAFIVGLYLPWILGFYYLVELSPIAFTFGVIAFTTLAVGKYGMFPAALDRLHKFSVTKKTIFAAIIIVPIVVVVVQLPLVRIFYGFENVSDWQKYFVISLTGGILISIVMTMTIVKFIAEPLNKIKEKSLEIKNGNYGLKVELSSNDEIGELVNTFNDMSETLEKDSIELKNNAARIKLLLKAFESSNAAIAILNPQGNIIEVNQKFTQFTNSERSSLLNKSFMKIHGSSFDSDNKNLLQSAINSGNDYEAEIRIEDSRTILLTATQFNYDEIDLKGSLIVEVEITHLKNLELKLAQSEKLAALGEMSAVLSHEIKTPLTSIQLNSEMLLESLDLNEEDKKSFLIIKKEIDRLNHLVKDVLGFSKSLTLKKSHFDSEELFDNVVFHFNSSFGSKGIEVVKNIEKFNFYADKEKLNQVIINLLDNSIDAVAGKGVIAIRAIKNNDFYEIYISDTGSGVSANIKHKIFDPFITSKASGTGLGLAISKKIIEEHNGEINIVKNDSYTTTVKVSIPIKINKREVKHD